MTNQLVVHQEPVVAPASEAAPDDRVRVLCIDESVGFGGATKSMALMLRALPTVQPYILTTQGREVREVWYRGLPIFTFRRVLNYRNRARLNAWIDLWIPSRLLRAAALKSVALIDAVYTVFSVVRILYLIKANRIEILHLVNGYSPLEALIAGHLAGVPRIVHLRGFFNGRRRSVRKTMGLASFVIGDSRAVFESVPPQQLPARGGGTIYEVVDVAAFDQTAHLRTELRQKWGVALDEVVLGMFGRVVEWKGQREFVHAAIGAMRVNSKIKAFIVGDESDGISQYFEEIRQTIRGSGLQDRFVLTGYIEEVEPYYAAVDIVAHASIEPEPCGMVILEGMAAMRAVIAADEGGPRELVAHEVDGLLVKPGDVDGLKDAILRLAADPDTRRAMGANGYRKVKQDFDVDSIAAELLAVYDGLLRN